MVLTCNFLSIKAFLVVYYLFQILTKILKNKQIPTKGFDFLKNFIDKFIDALASLKKRQNMIINQIQCFTN